MLMVLAYVAIALGLCFIFVISEVLVGQVPRWSGVLDWEVLSRPIIITVGTLSGFLSKSLADELLATRETKIKVRELFSSALRSRSFWGSMILAPLVLLLFYRSITEVTSTSLLLLLAYENAFFFRSFVDHTGRLIAEK